MRWIRRFAYWLRFRSRQHDLREELALHHELLAEEFGRQGLTRDAARDAARRAMGNETYMREEARGVWLSPRLDALLRDWRYAWRGLRRAPAFTLIAIGSLALGIGANTAIFGLIHALLLARLPVPHAAQLVETRRDFGAKGIDERFSRSEFDALTSAPIPLTMLASSGGSIEVDGVAMNASLDAVDGGYFDLLGIRAERGRLISRNDDADAVPIAVVTDRFWRGRMNADPAAIGRIIRVNGQPFTVVGITPAGFAGLRFPAITDVMVPYRAATTLHIMRASDARTPSVTIVGRRPSAQPIESARLGVAQIWNRCCAAGELVTLPKAQTGSRSQLVLVDISRGIPQVKLNLRGQYSRILLALMAGVGILLLAACANVANLLLARSSARSGELAVRLALGASRARLVLLLVIESIQLSLLGALFGVLLARWGTTVLMRAKIGDLSGLLGAAPVLGPEVLAFTIIVSVVSGLIFGVVPALRVMRSDLITPLKQGGRRSTSGRRALLDRGLVALQMALALLLVSGAMLLVQTLRNLQQADLGFDPAQRLAVSVETRRTSYERQGMTVQMADEMLRRVRAIPGVRSAAFGSSLPIYGGRYVSDNVTVRGGQPLADGDAETWFAAVTPGYFESLGIPPIAGRDIDRSTALAAPISSRDVVVNDLFAKKFFPGRNAIGQVFDDRDNGDTVGTENRVIGVVGSAKFSGLRAPPTPMYFVPLTDHDWPFLVLVVRPQRGALGIEPVIARAITSVAPGIAHGDPSLISAAIDDALARERISAALASLFGAIALSLVAVGLYGVMLYQVAERTSEIGIRMALGAGAGSVVALVLRQSLAIVAIGLVAGFPLAMLAGRAVTSQLYGVAPYSVWALTIAGGSLVAVAVVASLVPVRRAISVDPLTALRAE